MNHLKKRNHQVEDEPDINHLYVKGFWKVCRHCDEHCGQNLRINEQTIQMSILLTSVTVRLTETTASKKKGLK